jgi:DnaJ-class molecular chaperone
MFRISYGAGQDLGSAVRAAKDSLKRTRQRVSLLVHPDKANNELARYKPVFEEAFKALTNAHDTLAAAADGKYEGSTADPQAQQQQQQGGAYGFAGFAGAPPGYSGFPGTWGWPGFNGFPGAYWQA